MTAIRRVYIYLVSIAALAALAHGSANVLRTLVEMALHTPSATTAGYLQDQVALWGSFAAVGLPIWALHWVWAQRLRADTAERASALRRLYLYAVLAGATLVASLALGEALTGVAMALTGAPALLARTVVPPLPLVAVALVVWLFHWRVATADRAAVGERYGSAALRRWYVYGATFVGFVFLVSGAQQILQSTWLLLSSPTPGRALSIPGFPETLVGLAVWWLHWAWLPRFLGPAVDEDDHRSTLRSVYLFLGLAVVVVGTLGGLSQALYYALARLFGVSEPGGVGGRLLDAAAGPVSVAAVFGLGWLYQRQVIAFQARASEAPRQLGVRRLYEYLTALVALVVFAVGVGGLLWMLGDIATRAADTLLAGWWRDRVSLFATLTAVGLPVWLLHWHPRRPADAPSLVRRLYLYLALIGGMLSFLGSSAVAGYRLLGLLLGSATPADAAADLSHATAVALVASGVSAYHWRFVQADTATAAPDVDTASTRVDAFVELEAPSPAALDAALASLRDQGIVVHHRAA